MDSMTWKQTSSDEFNFYQNDKVIGSVYKLNNFEYEGAVYSWRWEVDIVEELNQADYLPGLGSFMSHKYVDWAGFTNSFEQAKTNIEKYLGV